MKALFLFLFLMPVMLFAQKNNIGYITITNSKFASIQDSIISKINKGVIPSFSVAVAQKGKVIWQQSFGWADKERKIKATPSTPYALASLSKSITSTALMILAEKRLINWNDPVDQYLGSAKLTYFKGDASQLTISHLTNMMGGIPHLFEYIYTNEKKPPLPIERQIERYGIVVFPPGLVFHYSNFSPAIAEQIIKHVTSRSLSQFMKEEVFAPLGMGHSAVNRNELSFVAKGYDADGRLLEASEFYPKGGAGYYASVADLLRYGMFHLKDKVNNNVSILSDKSIDFLHIPGGALRYNKYYANGWGILKLEQDKTSLLSNGAIDGAASSLLLLPDQDIAIACLTNATVGNDFTDQIAFQIADVLLPGYLDGVGKFIEAIMPTFSDQPFQADTSMIGVWEGDIKTYQGSIPIQLVFDSSHKIFVRIKGQYETVLNQVVINNGLIHGQCFGYLPLPEAEGIPHYLAFVLKRDHNELYGSINAQSFLMKRPYFLIPAFVGLKKKGLNF